MALRRIVRLKVPAAAARPGPAIGQSLGPLGLNMAEFCKQFNERTKNLKPDTPMNVELKAFTNRQFTFVVKSPSTSWFLKKAAGIETGSGTPGHAEVGKVHWKQIYEIAEIKKQDPGLEHVPLQSLCRTIAGTAYSMGLDVVGDEPQAEAK